MEIPESIYLTGQVAVAEGVAHRLMPVVVKVNEREIWNSATQSLAKKFDKQFRYGIGCIRTDADQPARVGCFSAHYAAVVIGITEACTTCWPNEGEK